MITSFTKYDCVADSVLFLLPSSPHPWDGGSAIKGSQSYHVFCLLPVMTSMMNSTDLRIFPFAVGKHENACRTQQQRSHTLKAICLVPDETSTRVLLPCVFHLKHPPINDFLFHCPPLQNMFVKLHNFDFLLLLCRRVLLRCWESQSGTQSCQSHQ